MCLLCINIVVLFRFLILSMSGFLCRCCCGCIVVVIVGFFVVTLIFCMLLDSLLLLFMLLLLLLLFLSVLLSCCYCSSCWFIVPFGSIIVVVNVTVSAVTVFAIFCLSSSLSALQLTHLIAVFNYVDAIIHSPLIGRHFCSCARE